jgi:hypothetical protein
MIVNIKNNTIIALVDIRNIADPTPISLVSGGIALTLPQHRKQALLPSLSVIPNSSSPYLGCTLLICIIKSV